MITDSFDNQSPAKILPHAHGDSLGEPLDCAACIVTFSSILRDYVLQSFPCREFSHVNNSCGPTPLYALDYHGTQLAFYMTGIGSAFAAGLLEEAAVRLNTRKFVVFGGAGCLDREIAFGKVMVPTFAYRDEGTSYHYAPPSDTIEIKNAPLVEAFMKDRGIPCAAGGTWTTDAIFRETEGNFQKRKAGGCISVEMECAALQAVCDFRGYELFYFLASGDLLDAPQWDTRRPGGYSTGAQHNANYFDVAAELALYISAK